MNKVRQSLNRKIACLLCAILVLSFLCGMKHKDREDTPTEYQLKAVFLFNFTQFVAWPGKSFENDKAPFVIGVLGENPYGSFLEETIRNESVNDHRIVVRYYDSIEEVKTCHILFIKLKNQNELEAALIGLKKQHILTVGETNRFTQLGGIISFVMSNNKIGIRVNLEAANQANLAISSKLLRLATIVKSKNN